jgi:hypothetical protein
MTFDEYKENGIVSTEDDSQLQGVKELGSSLDEHFINLLLFQAQLKIMH